jgi:hypothetical protein
VSRELSCVELIMLAVRCVLSAFGLGDVRVLSYSYSTRALIIVWVVCVLDMRKGTVSIYLVNELFNIRIAIGM